MATFILDILLFSILAWYFDHVDDSNRGKNYSKLFFLDKNYWFPKKSEKMMKYEEANIKQGEPQTVINPVLSKEQVEGFYNKLIDDKSMDNIMIKNDSSIDAANKGAFSVSSEKVKILKSDEEGKKNSGLRVLGVTKQYIQNDCCKKHIVDALKPVKYIIKLGFLGY